MPTSEQTMLLQAHKVIKWAERKIWMVMLYIVVYTINSIGNNWKLQNHFEKLQIHTKSILFAIAPS